MKILSNILAGLCLVFSLSIIFSCKKNTDQPPVVVPPANDSFTITAKVMEDCDGHASANYEVTAIAYIANMQPQKIGVATTDANGNLTIKCRYFTGLVDVGLYRKVSQDSVDNWIQRPSFDPFTASAGQTYDWGTSYAHFRKAAISRYVINKAAFGPNDTLYYGGIPDYAIPYFPIPDNLLTTQPGVGQGNPDIQFLTSSYDLYWGVGKKNFDSAYNLVHLYGSTANYHVFHPHVTLCTAPDTVVFHIP